MRSVVATMMRGQEVNDARGVCQKIARPLGAAQLGTASGVESCGGCPRLPVWSSPTVLIKGEPAGTAELDNARVISEQAARVAAFR